MICQEWKNVVNVVWRGVSKKDFVLLLVSGHWRLEKWFQWETSCGPGWAWPSTFFAGPGLGSEFLKFMAPGLDLKGQQGQAKLD